MIGELLDWPVVVPMMHTKMNGSGLGTVQQGELLLYYHMKLGPR